MPTVSRTFTVSIPPAQVLEYLKDFANAEHWDPGTQRCTRLDSGPVVVGSRWHNESKIFGVSTELEYTLKEVSSDRVVFEGNNKSSTTVDTIVVTAAPEGAQISYQADLTMRGAGKLADPAMKLIFEKLAGDTEAQMTSALNGLRGN
ncbi:polyketide cyclase [Mycobacterium sp. MS1601]|uniref:SRPBCC family protein n=1 Tax=Mycobacterium sp. MS1601 TaxID=1936029 RepID=UPI000979097E|nr:SRPBCC family protein [Mycobacterium sp. MS1601]AQA05387.1 polyketide cyclase [Mycobacterium sp. MS1601]